MKNNVNDERCKDCGRKVTCENGWSAGVEVDPDGTECHIFQCDHCEINERCAACVKAS